MTFAVVLGAMGTGHMNLAQSHLPPTGTLHQLREVKEAHLDNLHSQMTDEEFYEEGGEYVAFQRWLRYWELRSPQGSPENYDLLMKNYCDAKFNSSSSYKSNDDPWHEIGPKSIANNMFGIGPVRHIAISRDNSDHMLCTSNSGGLFYTPDANASCTWRNGGTDVGLPHSGCNWADFYPGSTEKWYTISSYGRVSYVGGLYRTATSGNDWTRIADYSDLEGPSTVAHKFLFDRKLNELNDHRLFLLTSQGLFVSDEPEATDPVWAEVQITPPASIAAYSSWAVDPNVLIYDMEYLAASTPTSTLCASMRFTLTEGSSNMTIWRFMISMDNGDTWTEAPNQPDIDPAFEWATVETSADSPSAFHCMVEKGASSWVKLYETSTQVWSNLASGFNPDFGAGNTFGVDQFNANSLIVGDDQYDVNWYLNGVEQVYVYPTSPRQYQYASTGHDDVEDVVGDPSNPGIFWVANHGGVSRVNTNVSPRTWEYKCEGLGVAETWSMSTSQNKPDFVALGLYHQCNVITRTPYSEDWDPDWAYLNLYGDGTLALMDHKDANILYYASQGGPWRRNDNAETSLTASQDLSISSQYHAEGTLNRRRPERLYRATLRTTETTPWINGNGVTQDFQNREIEVLRSFDRGESNEVISDFGHDPEVSHSSSGVYKFDNEMFWWMRASLANPNHLYVGIRNWDWQHRIYRTTKVDHPDSETVIDSWEEVPHPRRVALGTYERDEPPVSFTMDPEDENVIYVAYSSSLFEDPADYDSDIGLNMVYRLNVSDLGDYPLTGPFNCDGSYPCTDITMNLPNTIVDLDGLVYEQGSDGGLYLATEVGTYFTNNKRIAAYEPNGTYVDPDDQNNGSGWVRLGGALPHINSRGLEINYNVNRIRTGLTGRGVWEHGLHCPPNLDITETGTYSTGSFVEARASITSDAEIPTELKVDYRGGSSIHLGPGFHAWEGARFHAFIHPCDLPGNSFRPKSGFVDLEMAGSDEEGTFVSRSLALYPNPASGSISVLCPELGNGGSGHVRFFDTTGKLALAGRIQAKLSVLDISKLNGLYTVVVDTQDARHVDRVVIE